MNMCFDELYHEIMLENYSGDKILIMVKPLGMDNIGLIEKFLDDNGKILRKKKIMITPHLIGQHYIQFKNKPFFKKLLKYYTGKDTYIYIYRVDDIGEFRKKVGDSKGNEGFRAQLIDSEDRNRIREEYGVLDNGIHSSDSPEEGQREIKVWFGNPKIKEDVYDQKTTLYVKTIHRKIMNNLKKHKDNFNYDISFSGGLLNGLALPGSPIDLDYRVFCEEDPVETGKKVANLFTKLVFDKNAVDPDTKTPYVKYEIPFKNGKADVAFVSKNAYKDKIPASMVATMMDDKNINRLRRVKQKSYDTGDKNIYKGTKKRISNIIKDKYLNEKFNKSTTYINKYSGTQEFEDIENAYKYAKYFHSTFENCLRRMTKLKIVRDYKIDIKSRESTEEKLTRKNVNIEELTDILRGSLYFSKLENIDKFGKALLEDRINFQNAELIEYDGKKLLTPTSDNNPYRGAVHLLLLLKKGNHKMIVELQLMLNKQKEKDEIHKLYKSENPENDANYMKRRMEKKFSRMLDPNYSGGSSSKKTAKRVNPKYNYADYLYENYAREYKEWFL